MNRREVNVFGTSFLDLLSGALAAVIILFVIVPKVSRQESDALQEIQRMNVQVEELADLIEQARNSVPQELFEQIQQQMEELQATVNQLSQEVDALQARLDESEAENRQLHQQVEELQQQIENQQRQIQQQQDEIDRLQRDAQRQTNQQISDGTVLGTNADVAIVCLWTENIDVDLYVQDTRTGEKCCYEHKRAAFGTLREDITSRSVGDDSFELFYQTRPYPGEYRVWVQVYNSMKGNAAAHVEGYVVMHPGRSNQIKIDIQPFAVTSPNTPRMIGTLTVTENNIYLQQ